MTIEHANKLGLTTRCVTNGYWGTSTKAARKIAEQLLKAGLKEINFSTGDDHQEFVPFDYIVNASLACAELGILSLVVVEGYENSTFQASDVLMNPQIKNFLQTHKNSEYFRLLRNVWMSFNENTILTQPDHMKFPVIRLKKDSVGCSNVLRNIVITPDVQLASCCGLTMEHIPEMKMGKVENNFADLYEQQLSDFMKIWLWIDGPNSILYYASQKCSDIIYDESIVHPCEACVQLYQNDKVKQVISLHYHELVDDVMFRFYLKQARENIILQLPPRKHSTT